MTGTPKEYQEKMTGCYKKETTIAVEVFLGLLSAFSHDINNWQFQKDMSNHKLFGVVETELVATFRNYLYILREHHCCHH